MVPSVSEPDDISGEDRSNLSVSACLGFFNRLKLSVLSFLCWICRTVGRMRADVKRDTEDYIEQDFQQSRSYFALHGRKLDFPIALVYYCFEERHLGTSYSESRNRRPLLHFWSPTPLT
jgi:hypothetical protein